MGFIIGINISMAGSALSGGEEVPATALLDEDSEPLLDEAEEYLLEE